MRRGALVSALLGCLLLAAPAGAVPPADSWLEGYAAAVLKSRFNLTAPSLRVARGVITLSAADLGGVDQGQVRTALQEIPGAMRVEITAGPAPRGEWLPGGTLFKPLIADPRWPHFAASYQRYIGDRQLKDVAAVSFGETFTLWRDKLSPVTAWEFGVQAGVFAVFDLDAESKDLVNADYFAALPVSFRHEGFSSMLRVFHQSSHLGDEFLLRTKTERVNLSVEGVDLKVSYEFGDPLRIYAGGGYLFDREPASLDPWSVQYGVEFISPWPSRDKRWRPVVAADVQHREENDWSADLSLRAGIQIDGVLASRNLQILLEYFQGHSPNGQFYKDRIEYFGLGAHFHF
ncbi:MAG TPA: DUF1207 domain-containing protein [Candidatus Acidoferrum sp.]|jgi:hypothetical protein|nr:DUF1207 domain-containing protein [Candidatus Acidoferrum sp.]